MPSLATGTQATGRTWATATSSSAHERIEQYNQKPQKTKPAKDPVFAALAWRAYHIPSFGWCEDWFQ